MPGQMISTGVPDLDLILGGGLPEGDLLLVVGPEGSGKTTLSLQMAFHATTAGKRVLFVSTLSEPFPRLVRHIQSFAFYDESVIGKSLAFVSLYPLIRQGLTPVSDALLEAAKKHQAALVVLDGLMTIHDLQPGSPTLRGFLYDISTLLSTAGSTLVVTSSAPRGQGTPELTMADGIVELGIEDVGTQTVRTIRAVKMRGLAPLLGKHALRIDAGGISVFPRLESVIPEAQLSTSTARVPIGMPEIDAMTFGGPVTGSSTILAGALGTGKTLFALHFVLEGARRGERGFIATFRESVPELVAKAATFGLDLEAAIRDGRVAVFHRQPVDLVADEVTWEMWREVERFAPKRFALDSVAELEGAIGEPRRRGYLTRLLSMLRSKGTTSLVTKEVAQTIGPELDFSGTSLAVLTDNLVLLRSVEFRGELYRVTSILKMRDSDFDRSIRQYTIAAGQGLRVVPRLETEEGVLTGIAKLPSELRVKRPTEAERPR